MARRVVRILLILVLAALAGVTGWQVWSLDRTRTQQRDDGARLQREALRVTQAILDLRASQRAYLSPGQGIAFWKPRVDTHLAALRDEFYALREQASASASPYAAAAAQADEEAIDALVALKFLEQRIADHVAAGRLQHAADMIYADGVRISLTLERAADTALTAHLQDLQEGRTRIQWTEGALLGLTAAIGFVLALLVMPRREPQALAQVSGADATGDAPERAAGGARNAGDAAGTGARATATGITGRRSEPAVQGLGLSSASGGRGAAAAGGMTSAVGVGVGARAGAASTPAAAARVAAAATATAGGRATPAVMMADDLPLHGPVAAFAGSAEPVRPAGTAAALAVAPVAAAAPAPAPASGMAVRTQEGLLAAAAELTVSVAKAGDLDGLRPVLARLAEHLDAVGVIVWLEDASSQRLTPIVTHGYPQETLAHLPPIEMDADNATARAWRLAELQIVAGRGSQPGAIVVPMPSSAGCVGVVSAEVRHGREHDPATLALARILAAQLAMLTGARG